MKNEVIASCLGDVIQLSQMHLESADKLIPRTSLWGSALADIYNLSDSHTDFALQQGGYMWGVKGLAVILRKTKQSFLECKDLDLSKFDPSIKVLTTQAFWKNSVLSRDSRYFAFDNPEGGDSPVIDFVLALKRIATPLLSAVQRRAVRSSQPGGLPGKGTALFLIDRANLYPLRSLSSGPVASSDETLTGDVLPSPAWKAGIVPSTTDMPLFSPIRRGRVLSPSYRESMSPVPVWAPVSMSDSVRLSSPFGPRKHPVTGVEQSPHNGIDIAGKQGMQLNLTPFSPDTLKYWFHRDTGHVVSIVLSLPDGKLTIDVMHLSGVAKYSDGSWKAFMGSTGLSTGPHFHIQLSISRLKDGAVQKMFVDPRRNDFLEVLLPGDLLASTDAIAPLPPITTTLALDVPAPPSLGDLFERRKGGAHE